MRWKERERERERENPANATRSLLCQGMLMDIVYVVRVILVV